ncbi:hypothetical protein ABHV46_00340 [Asaia sp. BMEF1]|uniref:hypothetical protein n=1 Tax=Asaia sp. BMEF1 TaxID=3155932 RepID=UPI003F671FD4
MSSDLTVASHVESHVEGWVIKTPSDPAPRRIAESDWLQIDRVLCGQLGKRPETALAALNEVFAGWLVQRAKGQRPSVLDETDYLSLLALLPLPDAPEEMPLTPEISERLVVSDEPSLSSPEINRPIVATEQSARRQVIRSDTATAQLAMALFHLDHGV